MKGCPGGSQGIDEPCDRIQPYPSRITTFLFEPLDNFLLRFFVYETKIMVTEIDLLRLCHFYGQIQQLH